MSVIKSFVERTFLAMLVSVAAIVNVIIYRIYLQTAHMYTQKLLFMH